VINAVRDTAKSYSWLKPLVADIQASLQEFTQWRIDFVKRVSNSVAHSLAQLAVRNVTEYTLRDEVPECIRDTILLESMCSSRLIIE
jgi:hypothetical protein